MFGHFTTLCMKGLKLDFQLQKKCFIYFMDGPSKILKNTFYFILKALFVFKIFNFCLKIWIMQKKRLHQKGKVDFKIYDAKKLVNKPLQYTYCPISHEVIRSDFSSNVMQKMSCRGQFQASFCLFKKVLYEVKVNDLQLSFNVFRSA